MSTKPVAPKGLGRSGSALWREVTSTYDLRADELRVLEAACRAVDRIDAMEDERDGAVMATGSMGQPVVHPLLVEIRNHEAQVASLLARLKLPDDPSASTGAPRSTGARAAAQSRWSQAHGASA